MIARLASRSQDFG